MLLNIEERTTPDIIAYTYDTAPGDEEIHQFDVFSSNVRLSFIAAGHEIVFDFIATSRNASNLTLDLSKCISQRF